MANEGNTPDFDLKMPSLDLEMPGPSPGLDLPDVKPALDLGDLKLDAPLEPAPRAGTAQSGAASADRRGKPVKKNKAAKVKAPKVKTKVAGPKMSRTPAGALLPVSLNVLSIVLLLVIAGIMYLFDVPVNAVPDLTLVTYVQALWLAIGCFFILTMLEDVKTALILMGLAVAMLATIFPTLWLLLDTPMNPMYFFVLGLVVLLAFVAMPLNVLKSRKPAPAKGKPAPAPAPAAVPGPTGPRTTS